MTDCKEDPADELRCLTHDCAAHLQCGKASCPHCAATVERERILAILDAAPMAHASEIAEDIRAVERRQRPKPIRCLCGHTWNDHIEWLPPAELQHACKDVKCKGDGCRCTRFDQS